MYITIINWVSTHCPMKRGLKKNIVFNQFQMLTCQKLTPHFVTFYLPVRFLFPNHGLTGFVSKPMVGVFSSVLSLSLSSSE